MNTNHPLGSFSQPMNGIGEIAVSGAFGLVKLAIIGGAIWYLFFKENAQHKVVYMKADEYAAYKKYFKRE